MDVPRVHWNPVITEEPGCNRRNIELMNRSSQTITYNMFVEASTISACRETLAIESAYMIESGGIELPGGSERWDLDAISVGVTIVKFYDTPVIQNLVGTGE